MTQQQTFLDAYIECALWSSTDDDGEPLDQIDDLEISDQLREQMKSDAEDFQSANSQLYREAMSDSQAGHDFWLTRNGHGAGFWDRGLGKLGETLTAKAKEYGGFGLYIGDDGKLYGS